MDGPDAAAPDDHLSPPDENAWTDALRARVSLVGPGVILLREVPNPTIASMDVMTAEVERLADGRPFAFIVDVREVGRPTARGREHVQRWLKRHRGGNLGRVVLVTGANVIMRAGIKFLARVVGLTDLAIVRDLEEARACLGLPPRG